MAKKVIKIEQENVQKPIAKTPSERKRIQRTRDKLRGHVEITIKVPFERIKEAQEMAAQWRKRKKRNDAGGSKKDAFKQPENDGSR